MANEPKRGNENMEDDIPRGSSDEDIVGRADEGEDDDDFEEVDDDTTEDEEDQTA